MLVVQGKKKDSMDSLLFVVRRSKQSRQAVNTATLGALNDDNSSANGKYA
jgi:hypothetical protein